MSRLVRARPPGRDDAQPDGAFELVEDDGETRQYTSGATRTTRLTWSDAKSTLEWTVDGAAPSSAQMFQQLFIRRFTSGGASTSNVVTIGKSGSLKI